ncbi:MAG TPA: flagellar basal-body rod protein FlgG [Desulfobacteraceae bacterium]|nr:flagellar basal-body rod protein FlgG [Desulfobacteraceae bacterium]
MIRGLWTAASGMVTQQMKIDIVSNNIANANTTGFKKSRCNFQDLMYQTFLVAGATSGSGGQIPTGIQMGMGVKPAGTQKIFTQGDYVQTGNDLDMAIEGKGFFKVLSGDEELYTRAGNFMLDSEGFVTTSAGDRLLPEISVPEDTVIISVQPNGQLTAYGSGGVELASAEINLYSFVNPAGLYSVGRNLLRPTEGSGEPVEGTPGSEGFGTISNSFLEMSNVSIVEEMVDMIVGQRAYEANSKSIQTADNMLQMANNIKR